MATETAPTKTCFIAMPISTPEHVLPLYGNDSEHFMHVLECLFIPAVEKAGLLAIPPFAKGSEVIHADIIEQLQTADLVLIDMSSLNANAFFEFGIRVAVNKPICVVRDSQTPKIPFDAAPINAETYNPKLDGWLVKAEIEKLAGHISASLERSKGQNAMWKHFGLQVTAQLPGPPTDPDDQFSVIMNEIAGINRSMAKMRAGELTKFTETSDDLDPGTTEVDDFLAFYANKGVVKRWSRDGRAFRVTLDAAGEKRKGFKTLFKSRFPDIEVTWLVPTGRPWGKPSDERR